MMRTLLAVIIFALGLVNAAHAQIVNSVSSNSTPVVSSAKSLCFIGDSILAQSDQITSPNYYAETTGAFGTWVNVYTQYRAWRSPQTNNFAVSGALTSALLAQAKNAAAAGCNVVVMDGGVNDVSTNGAGQTTCNTATANLSSAITYLLGRGIAVIDTTITPPNGTDAFSTAQIATALCINSWRREFARGPPDQAKGYFLADLDTVFIDPTATTWTAISGYVTTNQPHPTAVGGSVVAAQVAPFINTLIPAWLYPAPSNCTTAPACSDDFDGTNNIRGNLLPNPAMAGTGGAVTSCTGSFATSIGGSAATFVTDGGTCVGSLVALSNNVTVQKLVIGGTMTGVANIDLQMSVATPANINAGDSIRGIVWANLGGTNTNIASFDPFMSVTVSSFATFHHAFASSAPYPIPVAGFALGLSFGGGTWVPLVTDTFTVSASPSSVYMDLRIGPNTTGAIASTVETCCWEIRKVVP